MRGAVRNEGVLQEGLSVLAEHCPAWHRELSVAGPGCAFSPGASLGLYFTLAGHGGRDQEEFPGHGLDPAGLWVLSTRCLSRGG